MDNYFENNIYRLLKTITQLNEKNINYQSLNYDLGFFKSEISSKIGHLLNLIKTVNEKFLVDLQEKIVSLDKGINTSNTKTNAERQSNIIKAESLKKDMLNNEKQLEDEFKVLVKEEEEALKDNYNEYQQQYIEQLKILTNERQLIAKNHQQVMDFTIEKYEKSKQELKNHYQEHLDNIRQNYQTFLLDIKKEEEAFVPIKNDFYQELNADTNEVLYALKQIQESINEKINSLNLFYDNNLKQKEENLKQEFANLTNLKKDQLQNKISKNETLENDYLIEINNLETDILIKQFTFKEDIIKTKIANLPLAHSLYKKYQMLPYTNKRNLVLLEKSSFLKELDNNENFFGQQQAIQKKLLLLKNESEKLYNDHSIEVEKADIEYKLKKNSGELQGELQYAELSKKFKNEQNRIYTEIERLKFIYRKLDEKFAFERNKNDYANLIKTKKYSLANTRKKIDIEIKEQLASLQKKDINAIVNYNISLNFHYQSFKKKYVSEILNNISTIQIYIQTVVEKLLQYILEIFKMIIIIYDNCYYMSDKFLAYIDLIKSETEPIINCINQISLTIDHIFGEVKKYLTSYTSGDIKNFEQHTTKQLERINNQISELLDRVKIEDSENLVAINNISNEIKKRRKFLSGYLSQVRKLKKIKDEKAEETKINYNFGFKKAMLDYLFLRNERRNLFLKQKGNLHFLNQNEVLKTSIKTIINNYLTTIKKEGFSFLKRNDHIAGIISNKSHDYRKSLDNTNDYISSLVKQLKSNPSDKKNLQAILTKISSYINSYIKSSKQYFAYNFNEIKNLYSRYLKLVKTTATQESSNNKLFRSKELSLINYQVQSCKQNYKILETFEKDYTQQLNRHFNLEKKNKNLHQDLERKVLNKNIKSLQTDIKNLKQQENGDEQILKTNILELQNGYEKEYKDFIKQSTLDYNSNQLKLAVDTKKCNLQLKQLEFEHNIKYVKLHKNYIEQKINIIGSLNKERQSIVEQLGKMYQDFKDKVKTDAILMYREIIVENNKIKKMKKEKNMTD